MRKQKKNKQGHFCSNSFVVDRRKVGVFFTFFCIQVRRHVMPRRAVAIFFFSMATWWAVSSCETREAAGSTEMTTWAGHTRHESRRCVGGSSFQGTAIGEGHRCSGGQRFSRTTVADICTRPTRRAVQDRPAPTSRRMSSFHSMISKPIAPDGAGTAEQKKLDAALVLLTRLHEEISRAATGPTQSAATPVQPDPTLMGLHQLRVRVAEMEAEREEFRKKRKKKFVCPSSGFDRGVKAECCVVPVPRKRQIRSDGNADRSRGNSQKKLASFQPFGFKKNVVSRAVGFLAARDRARSSCVRSVVARCGLRDIRVGEASQPGPPDPAIKSLTGPLWIRLQMSRPNNSMGGPTVLRRTLCVSKSPSAVLF